MSFIARPVAIPPKAEPPIRNDGFFPDMDLAEVREAARIPSNITSARLRAALVGAILSVSIDLAGFKLSALLSGYASLADMPAPLLDGESVQIIRYRRAVTLLTKAELIERHRDFDTTAAGHAQADELDQSLADLHRDALHAVRDILGRTRTTVDLI